jgi:hypothetical protein
MTALILILLAVAVLSVLDVLALRFGVDSREGIGDDHARPTTH